MKLLSSNCARHPLDLILVDRCRVSTSTIRKRTCQRTRFRPPVVQVCSKLGEKIVVEQTHAFTARSTLPTYYILVDRVSTSTISKWACQLTLCRPPVLQYRVHRYSQRLKTLQICSAGIHGLSWPGRKLVSKLSLKHDSKISFSLDILYSTSTRG